MQSESETQEELLDHIIEVDQYTSLTIKIPKVMTPMDLKALMHKANKIFNISEVTITGTSVDRPKRVKFTDAIRAKMYELRVNQKLSWRKIDEQLSVRNADKHYHYLKNNDRWNKTLLEA